MKEVSKVVARDGDLQGACIFDNVSAYVTILSDVGVWCLTIDIPDVDNGDTSDQVGIPT